MERRGSKGQVGSTHLVSLFLRDEDRAPSTEHRDIKPPRVTSKREALLGCGRSRDPAMAHLPSVLCHKLDCPPPLFWKQLSTNNMDAILPFNNTRGRAPNNPLHGLPRSLSKLTFVCLLGGAGVEVKGQNCAVSDLHHVGPRD